MAEPETLYIYNGIKKSKQNYQHSGFTRDIRVARIILQCTLHQQEAE